MIIAKGFIFSGMEQWGKERWGENAELLGWCYSLSFFLKVAVKLTWHYNLPLTYQLLVYLAGLKSAQQWPKTHPYY